MRKFITVHTETGDVQLRLTLGGQKALKAKYPGKDTLDVIMDAATDAEAMADVLNESLHFAGNENPKTLTGEEFYDTLVDEGYSGQMDFGTLAIDIAKGAGLLDEKQKTKLLAILKRSVDGVFDALDNAEDAPEEAVNPIVPLMNR
nr:MAG TPA: hypothetical protein [Caudoviricetes sp.]